MVFAEKDAVVAEFFSPHRAFVNLVDVFNATVDAVQAEFHLTEAIGIKQQTIVGARTSCPTNSTDGMRLIRSPLPRGPRAHRRAAQLSSFALRRRVLSTF